MGRKFLTYTFGAVALYILVANGSKSGQLFKSGASAYSTAVKSLQGR